MNVLAQNKKAGFDYQILETFEAGLELLGHEVKSIKSGHISLKEAYITVKNVPGKTPELYLIKAHVSQYRAAGQIKDYNPVRPRKLLLRKTEIMRLVGKKQEQGLTLIPLKIYTKRSFIKVEIAIAQGRKKYDKREVIKKREVDRRLQTLTKKKIK